MIGNIVLEEEQLEDQERDGQNKFWGLNRFKPNPWQMMRHIIPIWTLASIPRI